MSVSIILINLPLEKAALVVGQALAAPRWRGLQASHFDVKILLAGVNPSPPCRPRAGTSRQHCRKVSVKIGFGNMAEPDHSGLP